MSRSKPVPLMFLEALFMKVRSVLVPQPCPTLCTLMDWSPQGPSIHGILQARILEWVAIPFSRGSSRTRDRTRVSPNCGRILYHLSQQGSPVGSKPVTIKQWMDKQRVFHPYHWMGLGNKVKGVNYAYNYMSKSQNNYTEWRKAGENENCCVISLRWKSRKYRVICSDRSNLVVTGYRGREGEAGGKDYKTQEETLGGYRYIHYLDCGDSFTGRLLSKLAKLYTLNMCSLLYVNYTATEPLLKMYSPICILLRDREGS